MLIVRHAEVDDRAGHDDPDLSADGRSRAAALAHVLGDTGVAAVYASTYTSTVQTAAPLAEAAGVPLEVRLPAPVGPLAREIRARFAGETVVVVGDTATIPALVAELGGPPETIVAEDEFDVLLAVTRPRFGRAGVVRLRYGRTA